MINANEQRVLDVAEGTFEYNGELYTVRPAYLKTLRNEFDKENVEITAEKADEGIRMIYGNVERGVREGYLMKLSQEDAEKAKKEGKVRSLSEIGLGDENKDGQQEDNSQENGQDKQQKEEVVTGKDGETYPIQQTPLRINELETLRTSEIESVQKYTSNEQIAGQLNANERQMAVTILIACVVCILVLTIYLKVFKHRKKAFLVMLGASLMSLSILVAGSVYVYDSWAYSPETWQTAAVESGYFKECSKFVQEDIQKIFSGVEMASGVELLALEDSGIYRDAKSIFTARLNGRELPKLEKRQKEIEEALQLVLVREPPQNVDKLSEVIMERYRKVLDTPYASFLYQLRQKEQNISVMVVIGSLVLLVVSIILIWKGSKYVHRKFRGLSYGIGVAGTSFIVANLTNLLWGKKVQAEPQAYQALFQHYMDWRSENILYFGILLLCISVFTWGAAYVTKKNHIEKQGLK